MEKQPVNELHFNLLGKLFTVAVGAWLVGKATNIKLRGTRAEIDAVARAMQSSRRFQDELRTGKSVEQVMQALNLKNASAREFERILGVKWPL
jgi:hypothetical protein